MLKVPRNKAKSAHHRRALAGENAQAVSAATGVTGNIATAATGNANTAVVGSATATGLNAESTATPTATDAVGDATTTTDTAETSTAADLTTTAARSTKTAAATTKQTTLAAISTTSTPVVVVVTSTSSDSDSGSESVESVASSTSTSSNILPTTATQVAPAVTSADGYSTVTGTATRTYATNNWLSSSVATATGVAAGATSGPSVGGIIGIVAGCLLGLISVAAAIGFFIRRARRNRRRARFNRSKFVRQSVALADGAGDLNEKAPMGSKNALALARANNAGMLATAAAGPRPPSMVERRVQAGVTAAAAAPGPGPGDVVDANGGYYDQDGYYHDANGHQPYEQYDYNQGDQQAQYDYSHGDQQGQYDQYAAGTQQYDQYATGEYQQSGLSRQPSMAPTVASQYPDAQDEFYQDGHSSVTPYQQEQYAEITRQLNNEAGAGSGSGNQLAVPGGSGNASVSRSLSTTYTSLNPHKPSKTYNDYSDGDRSGTPTDRNPQQTYFPPSTSNEGSPSPSNKYAAATAGRHRTAPTRAAHRSIDDDENAN